MGIILCLQGWFKGFLVPQGEHPLHQFFTSSAIPFHQNFSLMASKVLGIPWWQPPNGASWYCFHTSLLRVSGTTNNLRFSMGGLHSVLPFGNSLPLPSLRVPSGCTR